MTYHRLRLSFVLRKNFFPWLRAWLAQPEKAKTVMPCPSHDCAGVMLAFLGVESKGALLSGIVSGDLAPLQADSFMKERAPVLVRPGLLRGLQLKSSTRGAR